MTIGEVARRSGFTVKALRFYERSALLPSPRRSPGGYRVYAGADLHRLEFIRQAKMLGLSLEAIRQLVVPAGAESRGATRKRVLRIIDERIDQAAAQIATLRRLQEELRRRRQSLARRRSPRKEGECSCLRATSPPRAVEQPRTVAR
jgi:DNA-binding transcriptional MerR regulator